jgi:hypothetical protein
VSKPELEYHDTDALPWRQQAEGVEGMLEKVLASDPQTGDLTRLTLWRPGTDSSRLRIQSHAFWEEVFIIDGSIEDLTLGHVFYRGFYACRPPGMKHGPWRTDTGVTQLEIRSYRGD